MAKYLFARYIWELTTIYRVGRITLKDLNERWRDCYLYDGKDIPRRTFDYHRKEIEMLFDLNFVCDKHDNTYHVEDDSGFHNGELRRWLVNSVAVSSIVREAEDIGHRISLERIPSSEPHLPTIIQALRENKVISFDYQSFERETAKPFQRSKGKMVGRFHRGCQVDADTFAFVGLREFVAGCETFQF